MQLRGYRREHTFQAMCSQRRQRKLGLPHTWTQKRSRGQAISQAESMIAWHTAFSLNMGSCTATRGYAELNCTGSGSERAANECSGRLPVSHVFVRIFRYVSTCAKRHQPADPASRMMQLMRRTDVNLRLPIQTCLAHTL